MCRIYWEKHFYLSLSLFFAVLPVEKLYLLLIDTKEKEKALWMEGGIPPPHTEFQAATEMRGERRSFLKTQPSSSSAPSSAAQSPIHQPKTEDVAKSLREFQATTLAIQTALTALQASEEVMQASQEVMAIRLGSMSNEQKEQFDKLDNSIKEITTQLSDVQLKAEQNTQKIQQTHGKLETVDKETQLIKQTNKSIWDSMAVLEMEKASYYLRFQNIAEEKNEDLRELVTGMLAELLETENEAMSMRIDLIYRVNSSYTRKNKLPREVHVKFALRSIRDNVLKAEH
ncbi:uncharacterized protein LOC123034820 [Varanus komodoensis]|uniref:uncharacterized protein LOC123034820 n=1 Tax=Varanus komodoensis TaxID=61221 RepID=UPI001CF76C81|nr:uncharacterized protein LOC123034820 [Varanus komodoensis]